MQDYRYGILMAGWILWVLPFFLMKRNKGKAQQLDRRARWGILLVAAGFALLWQGRFWELSVSTWRLALAVLFFVLASVLSWTATRALGRHWRIDAGLNAEHELVMAGPYQIVRHPIYTSMLCLMLAMGFLFTPLLLLALAFAFAVAGTEIRVRIEDGLLASRFDKQFEDYKRSVAAYIPLLR